MGVITEEIRAQFRAKTGAAVTRYGLCNSYVQAGVRYSTDGIIMLAEPAAGEPDTEGAFPEKSAAVLDKHAVPCIYVAPLPAGEDLKETCKVCKGSGKVKVPQFVECKWCHGSGEVMGGDDCEHECGRCYGRGHIPFHPGGDNEDYFSSMDANRDKPEPAEGGVTGAQVTECEVCDGHGFLIVPVYVQPENATCKFDRRMLGIVNSLPGLNYGFGKYWLRFTCDGGEGVLMGIE